MSCHLNQTTADLKDSNPISNTSLTAHSMSFIPTAHLTTIPSKERTHTPTAIILGINRGPGTEMLAYECIAPLQLRGHAVNHRAPKVIVEIGASAREGPQVLALASSAAGVGGSAGIARPGGADEIDGVGGGVHVYDCEVGGVVSGVLRSCG